MAPCFFDTLFESTDRNFWWIQDREATEKRYIISFVESEDLTTHKASPVVLISIHASVTMWLVNLLVYDFNAVEPGQVLMINSSSGGFSPLPTFSLSN